MITKREARAKARYQRGLSLEEDGRPNLALHAYMWAAQYKPRKIKYLRAAAVTARTLGWYGVSKVYFKRVLANQIVYYGKNSAEAVQAQKDLEGVMPSRFKVQVL